MPSQAWSFAAATDFDRLAPEWDALNRAHANLPILDSRFFSLLMANFPLQKGAMIAMRHETNGPTCAAILERKNFASWQTYQPSQAPLGACINAAGFDVVSGLRSLWSGPLGLSLTVGLSQLDGKCLARPSQGSHVRTLDYIDTASISVEGGFDEYWAQRGKNLKQNVKRQRSRFERDGITSELVVLTEPAAVAQAVVDYGVLESRGWKGTQGTALHPSTAQGRFYGDMLREYAANGEAVAYQYKYGDKVVAADLCVARGGVLIILKTCYDETQTNTSPAMLMHHAILESIFREGRYHRIEFYGRVMEWHSRLTEEKRTLYHLNCFRFPWLSRLAERRSHRRVDVDTPPKTTESPNDSTESIQR